MDVEWIGPKGRDSVASICSNSVLRWAKASMLGSEIKSIICLFGNNIDLSTSVNLAGKGSLCLSWGSAVTCISVITFVKC